MQITEILAGAGAGGAAASLSEAFGIDRATAEKALAAVLPAISQRIERNTLSRGGVADLVAMLGRPELQRMINEPKSVAPAEVQALGVDVLDQVFWSKDKSRAVAARAAAESGLSESLIKKMLPAIAAMAMGGLAKGAGGELGQILARLSGSPLPLPGEKPATSTPSPQPTPRPDRPSSGGSVGQQTPLPVPGERRPVPRRRASDDETEDADNPYGDLGDIIRRGGHQIPGGQSGTGGVDGNVLGDLVRGILGQLLGFQNKGVLAWIINYVIFRWGWGLVKRILSRVLLGR